MFGTLQMCCTGEESWAGCASIIRGAKKVVTLCLSSSSKNLEATDAARRLAKTTAAKRH
jgi:hypothetical protein